MSIATLVLGESGTGKSTSLRNMNPEETLLIQIVKKPMPFRGWSYLSKENPRGNIVYCPNWIAVCEAMKKTQRKAIVIDDFQYLMSGEFMMRTDETGFQKFTEIGRHAYDVLMLAGNLADDVRVYILSHTNTDETGKTRCKTIGKLLDEKITVEGLFTIVLRTHVDGGSFQFSTVNNGSDTVKSPIGMFCSERIDNDLAMVDSAIVDYYQIQAAA